MPIASAKLFANDVACLGVTGLVAEAGHVGNGGRAPDVAVTGLGQSLGYSFPSGMAGGLARVAAVVGVKPGAPIEPFAADSGGGAAIGLELTSVLGLELTSVLGLGLTSVLGLGLTSVLGLGLTSVLGLGLTSVLGLTLVNMVNMVNMVKACIKY
jgi:hypothetical protein